jgi:hypothetical protein
VKAIKAAKSSSVWKTDANELVTSEMTGGDMSSVRENLAWMKRTIKSDITLAWAGENESNEG